MLRTCTKTLLSLTLCFVFAGGVAVNAPAHPAPASNDSVWMYLMSFKTHEAFYFDIGRDGSIFAVREDRHSSGFNDVRAGKLSAELTERVFSVVTSKEVLDARDAETGEQIFSDSEWVSLGLLFDERLTDLWGFREELKDYPEKFRRLVSELKSLSRTLPPARNTKAVIYAEPVEARRVQSIKADTRRFYDFVNVGESQLAGLPGLAQAVRVTHRRFVVENPSELETYKEFLKQSNLKNTGHDFFVEHGGRVFQVELRMRAMPRIIY